MSGDILTEIRQEIEKKGWSMYRVAKEAGVSQTALKRTLVGEHSPTIDTLNKIIKPLGLRISIAPLND